MYEVGTVWAAMCGLVGLLRGALLSNLQAEGGWFLMQEPEEQEVEWGGMDTRYGLARNH